MNSTIEEILNGPDYFSCEKYHARMKKILCVEKQAGPQAGFDIDYANSMCKECAQGIEIKGEVQGLDIKQIRRERRAFKHKHKKAKSSGFKDQDENVGANNHLPIDEHISDGGQGMEGKGKCIVAGCQEERFTRGLCKTHYWKWQKKLDTTIEPLPKWQKRDRLDKLKKSAERVGKLKAKSSKVKVDTVDTVAVVAESVSAHIVPFNVEKMEEQNRADVKIFARAFMAGLKGELISAMTDQISSNTIQTEAGNENT